MTAIKMTMEEFNDMEAKKVKKETMAKKDKKEKKEKKRKLEQHDDKVSDENAGAEKVKKKSSKDLRADRRREREQLTKNLPKADEHGIAFTKQQLRRMRKRVARGLDPIETPHERDTRIKQDSALRKEEEEEMAGMLVQKEDPFKGEDDDEEADDNNDNDDAGEDQEEESDGGDTKTAGQATGEDGGEPQKKARRAKPVPPDYVCFACKNKQGPVHWIYDCPEKKTVRGTNQVKRHLKGINNPDDRKVFVSGLPFEAKVKDVSDIFSLCGTIAHCKLITFEDTGRCKGTGIVTFDTDEAAKKALKMSGTVIDNEAFAPPPPKKKKGADDAPEKTRKKELKLKVTKVLNRAFTKKK